MMRLASLLLHHLHQLASLIDKCAELDCLIAFSKASKEYNFVRPTLTSEKIISIQQGRHPLLAASGGGGCVPNDLHSGASTGCVKLLAGPNSSGKSIYIKQIGLIVFMAHVGCFVPAESATIGVVTHIHSRLHTTECVASHMSAFLIDLRQMSMALHGCTGESLVLVDEFGAGTGWRDGLALLLAALHTLLLRGPRCPHLLLATHYQHIKQYIVDTPLVNFLRFEYMMQDGSPVFLYRVSDAEDDAAEAGGGGGGAGVARQTAAAAGVPRRPLQRAGQLMDALVNKSLPPENKRITAKLNHSIEMIKKDLLTDDI